MSRGEDALRRELGRLAREQAAELARHDEELRRQNEELKRVDRLKDEFLATISHELRTPLNAIIGFSQLMMEGLTSTPLPPEHHEYVTDIHRAGQHLLGLINDILDLAKLDAGYLHFQNEPVNLSRVVREAEEIARAMAMRRGLSLRVDAEEDVACIGDVQRLRQVTLNLLSNAVKFTPPGGHVTVRVRHRGGAAELWVSDSGIGIDPAHHAFIFDAFRQVDGSETREHAGTGLGLALVKRFVEAMRGTVRVDSRMGQGATFVIELPAWPSPGTISAARSGTENGPP